eukprot:gene7305-7376_t
MGAQFMGHSFRQHEGVLCEALNEVVEELLLVDPGDYIAFIRTDKINNIRDIVHSSTELYFPPGALVCGYNVDYRLDWSGKPLVSFGMMLHHADLRVAFSLYLGEELPRVKIHRIEGIGNDNAEQHNVHHFKSLLGEAQQMRFNPIVSDNAALWDQVLTQTDKPN